MSDVYMWPDAYAEEELRNLVNFLGAPEYANVMVEAALQYDHTNRDTVVLFWHVVKDMLDKHPGIAPLPEHVKQAFEATMRRFDPGFKPAKNI
jgi:hypothetical protein